MLKTNTKIVMDRVKAHILEHMELEDLKANLKSVFPASRGCLTYGRGIKLAKGGCFLCYYWNVREFLKETLEETQQESEKYSDEKCWDLYCHLIGRGCEKLVGIAIE